MRNAYFYCCWTRRNLRLAFFGAIKIGAVPGSGKHAAEACRLRIFAEQFAGAYRQSSALPLLPATAGSSGNEISHLPGTEIIIAGAGLGDVAAQTAKAFEKQACETSSRVPFRMVRKLGSRRSKHSWNRRAAAKTMPPSGAVFFRKHGATEGVRASAARYGGLRRALRESHSAGDGERSRFFSMAKLFFAYGLNGNGLYFPLAVGGTSILLPEAPRAKM